MLALQFLPKASRLSLPVTRTSPTSAEETFSHSRGILIVRLGGRVEFINETLRTWLGLPEKELPTLETLANRIWPTDEFLYLCAHEGEQTLSLGGRPVEVTSFRIPGEDAQFLLTLNRLALPERMEEGTGDAAAPIKILSNFNQAVLTQTGLPATVRAALETIERLVPVDNLILKLWYEDQKQVAAYRLISRPRGGRSLERSELQPPAEFTAVLIEMERPLYLADAQEAKDSALRAIALRTSVRSFIGLPLKVNRNLIGTLEASLTSAEAYSREDFEILQLISGPLAIALRNALLLDRQERQSKELDGLTNLARLVGEVRDWNDLFAKLVETLAPLFDVRIFGFLILNEERHTLEAQVPFKGMPSQVVSLYRIPLTPGSVLEEAFIKQELLVTRDMMNDERWHEMGFQDYARAASIRDSALVPLVCADRLWGYLQIANHNHPESAFSSEELRLLTIVAAQAAALIDDVALHQQARRRTQRLETLRRITNLAASSATSDEFLTYMTQELSRLLSADMVAVLLFEETSGLLRLHEKSVIGLDQEARSALKHLLVTETQFPFTVTGSRHPILSHDLAEDQRLLPLYRPLHTRFGFRSAILVPLAAHQRSVGEVVIASKKREHFNVQDLQIVSAAASQAALHLERTLLASLTDAGLQRRVEQLTAMTRISREINTTTDLNYLIRLVYDELLRTTGADCGSLVLFDLEAQGSPLPKVVLRLGESSSTELLPLEREVLRRGESLLISDHEQETAYPPAHEGIRSSLVTPIAYQQSKAGLIHLHSFLPGRFDRSSLEIAEALAIQAAIAIGNAQRLQELQQRNERLSQRTQTLSKLLETASVLASDLPLEQALETVAYGIQESTPFEAVLISVIDQETMMQRRVCGVGMPIETLQLLKSHQQAWSSVAQLLRPEFRVGKGYFIPHDQRPVVSSDVQILPVMESEGGVTPDAWHKDDALLYPITDVDGNPIGLISLDAPRDGKRPSRLTLETIEIFVAQAALIIQSKQRISAYRNQVERLTTSLERQRQLLAFSQGHLPALLHKDLEQMIAIHRLEQRARRIRAGLEITEMVTRQVDVPSVLRALGREMLTRLEMSVSLVAENTLEGPRLLQVAGNIPRGVNPEALFGQRNPLRHTLQTGETLLVMNLDQDDTWRDVSLLTSLHAKAFICLPVFLNNQVVAGVLVMSNEPLPALTEEDRQVYEQISRQVSIILQDISLLTETRRRLREVNTLLEFSNELSALDAEGMLKVLLDNSLKVITTAHAGIVFLLDMYSGLLVPRVARGYADVESMLQITYAAGESLPGRVLIERKPLRVDEVNFSRDYTLSAEGLLHYREATGGRLPVSSIVVPIQTGENILGILLLDNFNQAAAFTRDDETLLLSLAQQVALSLENARLMQASQERAAQLQALTLASAAMAANLRTSDLIATLLDRLYNLLLFDTAILWLREEDRMRIVAARGFADNEERVGLTVNIEDSLLLAEMKRTSQAIVVGDVRHDPRFPTLLEAERLSWLGVPLVSKGDLIGVIALEKTEANYFTQELVQLANTFASQAAVALENARLYEESVQRAAELDERSRRLARLNLFSSSLSGVLDEMQILRLTAAELQRALNAERIEMVSLENPNAPVLRLIYSRTAEHEEREPLPPAPIFERLRESLGVFTTEDASREADLAPLADLLADTRSLLIIPLVSGVSLRALAFVHLPAGERWSAEELELARTIANQAAIALEGARLYQATVLRAEQMSILNRASYEISASLEPEEIYRAIHRAAAQLMPVESFVITLLDEERNEIEGVYLVDPDGRAPNQRIPLGQGLSSRILESGEPILIADAAAQETGARAFGRGHSRSILAVPIKISGKTIGMLSVQSYQPNVYDEEDLQVLSTLANQAAVAIQNGRLFAETRRLADELEQRVIERTAELAREQRNTETLLRILTEASSTLDLDRALNRTLALLNDAIGAEQGSILLVDEMTNTIHYRAGYGYLTPVMTEGSRPTSFKVGEGLVGWVIQNRQSVCLPDVTQDPRWKSLPFSSESHRSVVAAPLLVGEEVIGAIMVFHRQVGYFSQEHVNLVQAIGAQVAVAINNAKLYQLIRDQAERLGAMVRAEQVEASRQQAILEAVADGVLVTNPENRITFLNPSAERILRLRASKVVGQPLDQFVGLFGSAARTWMTTIRAWSEDPSSYQPGETYAEQIKLEDGRVVLVHLSPVIWRNDFLGTVSIFRDITREVEVDRLKSEFVATVSHELRTPMTSIKGYVDLLLMGAAGALNENQIHFLEVVRSNTDRLSVLVNDLLDISRIEAGRVTLTFQPVDLRALAEDTVDELLRRSQEESKPMAIMLDAPPDLPPAHGDPERIRQIFANLTDNAYNYTPAGGEIEITIQVVNDMLQVAVRDNGIGIPPENLQRVFERFYRGEDALVLATPGTGLGLSIVEQLVKMHHGEIWAESEGIPGRGSTFYFTLPIYRPEE